MIQILFDRPMPKGCFVCPLYVPSFCAGKLNDDKQEWSVHRSVHKHMTDEEYENRPEWCPLKELSTIEPKRGEWIDTKGGWKCTACDKWASFASDFCPNCGARMK